MRLVFGFVLFGAAAMASAQYASHGLVATSTSITGWATGFTDFTRGPANIANPTGGNASVGTGSNALGANNGTVVSLGDGGSITLTFDKAIRNGSGTDFAVFENGFGSGAGVFAELAFVEVSSNGSDFFRLPSISLTQTATQVGAFAVLDPTKIHNLAGQFVAGEGSEFDLQDMIGVSSLLNVNSVTHVRVIDVVGSIDPRYARYDSQGHIVNDPYSTPFVSGGFDLDAVGVVHAVPEPASMLALGLGGIALLRRRRR